jgi:hypothetical protein
MTLRSTMLTSHRRVIDEYEVGHQAAKGTA